MTNSFIRLARLNQPIGTWLLLFPCWWSVTLASEHIGALWLYLIFGLGAITMRSAGCVFNDIADRNYDNMVERTKNRPLASREISIFDAILFLLFLLTISLLILLQLNKFAIVVGACSLALIFIYPFMKRVTFWPQAFLGLTFNWGALLGWASVREEIGLTSIILYFAGFFWTLGYDTIYAHQDKLDDAYIGIKSTALKFNANTKIWLFSFYALSIILFCICGTLQKLSVIFFIGIFAICFHFYWQVSTLDINSPENCAIRFRSNQDCGWIIFIAISLA